MEIEIQNPFIFDDFIIQSGQFVDEHFKEIERLGDMTDQFDEIEDIRKLLLKEKKLGNFIWKLSEEDMQILQQEHDGGVTKSSNKKNNEHQNNNKKEYQLNLDKIKEQERESQTTYHTMTPPKKSRKCSQHNSQSGWKQRKGEDLCRIQVEGVQEVEEDSFEEKLKETPQKHSTNNKVKGTYEEEMKMKRIEREFRQKMSSIKVDKKMDSLKRKSIEAMSNKLSLGMQFHDLQKKDDLISYLAELQLQEEEQGDIDNVKLLSNSKNDESSRKQQVFSNHKENSNKNSQNYNSFQQEPYTFSNTDVFDSIVNKKQNQQSNKNEQSFQKQSLPEHPTFNLFQNQIFNQKSDENIFGKVQNNSNNIFNNNNNNNIFDINQDKNKNINNNEQERLNLFFDDVLKQNKNLSKMPSQDLFQSKQSSLNNNQKQTNGNNQTEESSEYERTIYSSNESSNDNSYQEHWLDEDQENNIFADIFKQPFQKQVSNQSLFGNKNSFNLFNNKDNNNKHCKSPNFGQQLLVSSCKKQRQKRLIINNKKVPSWANNLQRIEEQLEQQPPQKLQQVFGVFCAEQLDLQDIFNSQQYNRQFDQRGSSAFWNNDQLTPDSQMSNVFSQNRISRNRAIKLSTSNAPASRHLNFEQNT